MRPGTGKSFVILLLIQYMIMKNEHYRQTYAITTCNQLLLDQMETFAQQFSNMSRVQFRLPHDFDDPNEFDMLFVDETYHQIMTEPLRFSKSGKPSGIFNAVGMSKRRVYLGGDYTEQFPQVLEVIDRDVVYCIDHPSIFDMLDTKAYNPMRVVCRTPEQDLTDLCMREVVTAAKTRPVIVFGMNHLKNVFEAALNAAAIPVYLVETPQ